MTNNDVLRRVRYLFDLNDSKMITLFKLADQEVSREQVSNWLKKDDDPLLVDIKDKELAIFLNGLIIDKRGKRDGPTPPPEDPLSNNMILRKLKIALELTTEDMIDIFALINRQITKNELGAFFRNPNHKSYRPCLDQYLRNFLNGLQAKYKK
ncbi:DUF1456 family protein [Cryomorphaceae bacterium 1068]|nr:DUF1456 family protein [Cryomorphaceae bacterium 1068]